MRERGEGEGGDESDGEEREGREPRAKKRAGANPSQAAFASTLATDHSWQRGSKREEEEKERESVRRVTRIRGRERRRTAAGPIHRKEEGMHAPNWGMVGKKGEGVER